MPDPVDGISAPMLKMIDVLIKEKVSDVDAMMTCMALSSALFIRATGNLSDEETDDVREKLYMFFERMEEIYRRQDNHMEQSKQAVQEANAFINKIMKKRSE